MKKLIFSILFLMNSLTLAADLPALERLFTQNFDAFYQPRFCNKNVERFVKAAQSENINLDNAYVLKIVGGGFFETSGFYTRTNPNEHVMLGYFHFVLVADNFVFDFDLSQPLVLSLEDYTRLQLSPPDNHPWFANWVKDLSRWQITRYEWADYISHSKLNPTWEKPFSEVIDVPSTLLRKNPLI